MAMADPVTGTLLAGVLTDVLEDLDRVIRNIDPTEVPFYSNAQKGTAKNQGAHEWLTDALRTPRNQPEKEGFDATFAVTTPRTRLSNVCQIAADSDIVSDTANAVATAPGRREIVYQTIKKGQEVRRDVEVVLLDNVAKTTVEPRKTAGMPTWIKNGTAGATGSLGTGDGSDTVSEGTGRALTLELISDAHQQAWRDGGRPTMLFMDDAIKKIFSGIAITGGGTSVINLESQVTASQKVTAIGAVSMYRTDYGTLEVVMDQWMDPAHSAFTDATNHWIGLFQRNYYGADTIPGRSFKVTPLAKTGSAEKFMVEWEGCLKVHNQNAHAAVFDINPSA